MVCPGDLLLILFWDTSGTSRILLHAVRMGREPQCDAPPGNTGKRVTQWPHPALGTVVNPSPEATSLDVSGFSPCSCKYELARLVLQ